MNAGGKKFKIEAPIYSNRLDRLIKINQQEDISILLYGGVPNSPLNGGRCNQALDNFTMWDRFFMRLNNRQVSKALSNFYTTITKANQNKIPFLFTFTNMFVSQEELSEENLSPIQWLIESSQKYGIKNGLILNNKLLENTLRQKYGDDLMYISSCTKYVAPEKILSPRETLDMYCADSGNYDAIVLTPQDSRREKVIKEALRDNQSDIIAIANTYCANACNCYHHYAYISKENKISLRKISLLEILPSVLKFLIPRATKCSAWGLLIKKMDIKDMVRMQLNAGITNFKLGRGFGDNLIDDLVSLISEFNN